MATRKTHTARQTGPVTFDVNLTAGLIDVTVDPNTDRAEITITTSDNNGPSADAVNNTNIDDHGTRIAAHVPVTQQGGGTIIQTGRGISISQNFGVVGATITSGGDVYVNGMRVSGSGTVVSVGGSPIHVKATLPAGSSLAAKTASADVSTVGRLDQVNAETMSGDLTIDGVDQPNLRTMSGDIRINALHGSGRTKSMSGDITVIAAVECNLHAQTMSGDITVSGRRVDLDASTMSGRVRNR